MVTCEDIGRLVWANDSIGELVRITSIPAGEGRRYETAVVSFDDGRSEQVFPIAKVLSMREG